MKMTFEEAMKRLEEIAELLENGSLGLDEAVKLYEESVELCLECKKKLDEGNGKIKVLCEKISGVVEEDLGE